jgi:hypothetical protein
MNYKALLTNMSPFEMVLAVVFILYLVTQSKVPDSIASAVDSPLGMVSIFIITILLFVYTNPVIALLYIFVGYELIRRSSITSKSSTPSVTHSVITGNTSASSRSISERTQQLPAMDTRRDAELAMMQPSTAVTLEEEVISQRSPLVASSMGPAEYLDSSFQPVADKLQEGVSLF